MNVSDIPEQNDYVTYKSQKRKTKIVYLRSTKNLNFGQQKKENKCIRYT